MKVRRILKIIFSEKVQEIFDHFSSVFDTRILFYSPQSEIIKVGLNRPNSAFCQLIQNQLYGLKSCLELDERKREEARNQKSMVRYLCHAGLIDSIQPIFFEDHLLGYIGMGQFRTHLDVQPHILGDWKKKYNPNVLEAAYRELPYVPPEKVNAFMGLFSVLVNYIVSQHWISSRGDLLLQKIISYIEAHSDQPITLKEIAALMQKSESTISHLFRKKLKTSFKSAVISAKLDKAEEYMRTVPGLKIVDIAERIGYDDPFYFSRIYKKYRHRSPRQFQKKIMGKK